MKKLEIRKDQVELLLDKRFLRMYDLQYAPGKHYYNVTRRTAEELVALKSSENAKNMLPDAVSCVVILENEGEEPRLLLTMEYRYPAGRFLLSVPAGLIDREDRDTSAPLLSAARREIREETGLELTDHDSLSVINPFLYSTPGMTDESNALVEVRIRNAELSKLDQSGAVGSELFDGFVLLNREEARKIFRDGRDGEGNFYSVYTWAALSWFLAEG